MKLYCIDCKNAFTATLSYVNNQNFENRCNGCKKPSTEDVVGLVKGVAECKQCLEVSTTIMGGKCKDCNILNKVHNTKIKYGRFKDLTFESSYNQNKVEVLNCSYEALLKYAEHRQLLEENKIDYKKWTKC